MWLLYSNYYIYYAHLMFISIRTFPLQAEAHKIHNKIILFSTFMFWKLFMQIFCVFVCFERAVMTLGALHYDQMLLQVIKDYRGEMITPHPPLLSRGKWWRHI